MPEIPMIHLTIDNKKVEVPKGTTILQAARKANIDIPTLCYLKEITYSFFFCNRSEKKDFRFNFIESS